MSAFPLLPRFEQPLDVLLKHIEHRHDAESGGRTALIAPIASTGHGN
jgi:hypothetical protein